MDKIELEVEESRIQLEQLRSTEEKITQENFKKATHPNENNRFILAMVIGIPVAIIGLVLTIASFGILLIYVALIVLVTWFVLSIFKVQLMGNAVKVSKMNFPEIYNIQQKVVRQLSYEGEIEIYIIESGTVNALLWKIFKTRFIVLNSELVRDMIDKPEKLIQMEWIIARFVGALKAKHFRTTILHLIFDKIEKIKLFNIFLLPYERATQYTGDNIGLLVTRNVEQSLAAFNKFIVGNDLSNRIEFRGILDQGKTLQNSSFFSFLARALSTHPHLINRYLNILAFASKEFPEQFQQYIDDMDNETKHNLFRLLPEY